MIVRARATIVAILLALLAAPAAAAGFPVRIVELGGDPRASATRAHLSFCRDIGFNAVWVRSRNAGAWTAGRAPGGPALDPGFLRLARWCKSRGMTVWVSLEPVADSEDRFVFTDEDATHRLLAFASMLRDQAGVLHVALSFDDQPAQLRELSDIFAYGASAAPAELDLARRLGLALPSGVELWLRASASCDAHLGNGTTPFAKSFLEGISSLPQGMGLVWTGPKRRSPVVTVAALKATRASFGNRPILLDDEFPANDNDEDDAIALVLGAIRGREPGIRDVVSGYLARPSNPLAGSRLSLLTTAAFLADPDAYDPGTAASAAVARLAGGNRGAREALSVQQMEWGGFMEGRNYWPRDLLSPGAAAVRLHDPAFVESFTWTVSRYPGRMDALSRVADRPFRDDLLRMMRRRLALARAIPLTVEYLVRRRAGRPDADEMLARLEVERRSWDKDPDARRVLDLFLDAASVPLSGRTP